jgi:hypothetical protein
VAARISSNRLHIEKDEPGSRLDADERLREREKDAAEVARAQDALRRKIGPIDVPVRELIDEGRD